MAAKRKTADLAKLEEAGTDQRTTRTKRTTAPHSQKTQFLAMSDEDLSRPGATLLSWLFAKANADGYTLSQLAEQLGVTYGYVSQLRSGARKTQHISQTFSRAAAEYLGVPHIAVLLAAGIVQPEDYYDSPESFRQRVDSGINTMRQDPQWGPLVPAGIGRQSYEYKRLLVLLYERATQQTLLPDATDLDDLVQQIQAAEKKGRTGR
ncbi:MAG: helix-turn-helix transcriptional regulator [Thiogranum sp.]|nr:helix-turn-helix transcriptional regulator [Thiogranum sp.]